MPERHDRGDLRVEFLAQLCCDAVRNAVAVFTTCPLCSEPQNLSATQLLRAHARTLALTVLRPDPVRSLLTDRGGSC